MHSVTFEQQLINPSKIICIGRNYLAHIRELGNAVPNELVVFLKPNSAITQTLHAEHMGEALHYEAELAYLYQQGKFVAVAASLDLTKRALQTKLKDKGLPWEKAKAFDQSALFSEFVAISDNDEPLSIVLTIDDCIKQKESNTLMIHKPSQILQEVESWLTLEDGDIVMTGTPKGVGQMNENSLFVGQVMRGDDCLVEARWQS